MALITRRPDKTLLIETRLDYFLEKWRNAPQDHKLVMDDRRPAVRSEDDTGISLTTIHPEVWDRVRRHMVMFLQHGELKHPSRARLCQFCGTELKVRRELTDCWVFNCPSCHTSEIHGKNLVGGTRGAGENEKV